MRLSICIPTHHGRARFLEEAIESVIGQLTSDLSSQIEICVSDNGSQDGTRELMDQYLREFPSMFVYSRHENDRGVCYNLLKVIEIAHGEYCWYLSSDDAIVPGGICRVLELLDKYPDTTGLAVHLALYDLEMEKEIAQMPWVFQPTDLVNTQVFLTADEALDKSLFFQGQMSQLVFNRELWMDVVKTEGTDRLMDFHYYIHIYVIGRMLQKHPKWLAYPGKLIKARQQNASLVALHRDSELEYVLVTVRDLSKTLVALRGTASPAYRIWMQKSYRAFSLIYSPFTIKSHRVALRHRFFEDVALSIGYARYWYFVPQFWYRTFPALFLPRFFTKIELDIRRKLGIGSRLRVLRIRLGKALQEWKYSGNATITTLDHHKMLLHPLKLDNAISRALVQDKVWEPFETKLFKEMVHSGMVVADLGANIGYYTLLAAKCVGPTGKVYAFEPGSDNYHLLTKNIRLNHYESYVVPINKAVASSSGEVELFLSPENKGDHRTYNSAIFGYDSTRKHVPVLSVCLDDFFESNGRSPDFIKMDVQGYEAEALKGMEGLLARCEKLLLLTEVWPKGLAEAGSSVQAYVQSLVDNGLSLYVVDGKESIVRPVTEAEVYRLAAKCDDSMYLNLLCAKGWTEIMVYTG